MAVLQIFHQSHSHEQWSIMILPTGLPPIRSRYHISVARGENACVTNHGIVRVYRYCPHNANSNHRRCLSAIVIYGARTMIGLRQFIDTDTLNTMMRTAPCSQAQRNRPARCRSVVAMTQLPLPAQKHTAALGAGERWWLAGAIAHKDEARAGACHRPSTAGKPLPRQRSNEPSILS